MNRQQIIAEVQSLFEKVTARREFADMQFPNIVFEVDTPRIFGRAFLSSNKLDFNEKVATVSGQDYVDTVRHEFAHLMVQHVYKGRNKQAHGPEFRMMCSLIGCSGKTYADISELKGQIQIKRNKVTRLAFKCNCGTHYLTKQRGEKVLAYGSKCRSCNSTPKHVKSVVVASNHPRFLKGA